MKQLQRFMWGMLSAVIFPIIWIANALLLIRNILILGLEIPEKMLSSITALFSVAVIIAMFFHEGGILAALEMGVVCFFSIFVAHFLFALVWSFVRTILLTVFGVLPFEGIVIALKNVLYWTLQKYISTLESDSSAKWQGLPLLLPDLFQKMAGCVARFSIVLSAVAYAGSALAGGYLVYWLLSKEDMSSVSGFAYLGLGIFCLGIIAVIIYFVHCLIQTVYAAVETIEPVEQCYEELRQRVQK